LRRTRTFTYLAPYGYVARLSRLQDSIDGPGGHAARFETVQNQNNRLTKQLEVSKNQVTALQGRNQAYQEEVTGLEHKTNGEHGYKARLRHIHLRSASVDESDNHDEGCEATPLPASFDDSSPEKTLPGSRQGTTVIARRLSRFQTRALRHGSPQGTIEVSSDNSDSDLETNKGSDNDLQMPSRHSSIVSRGDNPSPPASSQPAPAQNAKRKRTAVLPHSTTPDTGLNKKKKKKEKRKVQAGSQIADPIKWVFLVPNDGGSDVKELQDLPRETRKAIE
jgi:hypothetical protein